ncbi:MAG: hypothetical protein R3C44_03535 [Chloroflexota bacterium]
MDTPHLAGWDGVVGGDVDRGWAIIFGHFGTSDGACVFAGLGEWAWDPKAMALVGQRAENGWVGMNCGIMDQLISAAGEEDYALLIDCRSLDVEPAPLPPDTAVIILDSNPPWVSGFQHTTNAVSSVRTRPVSLVCRRFARRNLGHIPRARIELAPLTRKRARRYLENERTLQAADAMRRGTLLK